MNYQHLIDGILTSGKELVAKAGAVRDIGITKEFLTEEDIAIERKLAEAISTIDNSHTIYAEEEHSDFTSAQSVWIIDPISGTEAFIKGLPHYAIAVSHVMHGTTVFGAVYDPSADQLFTAYHQNGAFLNGNPLAVSTSSRVPKKIAYKLTKFWPPEKVEAVSLVLQKYECLSTANSLALNYCLVATGDYDGHVCLAKDSFPHYAGEIILREAGGIATNGEGEADLSPDDRVFVGANAATYQELMSLLDSLPSSVLEYPA